MIREIAAITGRIKRRIDETLESKVVIASFPHGASFLFMGLRFPT